MQLYRHQQQHAIAILIYCVHCHFPMFNVRAYSLTTYIKDILDFFIFDFMHLRDHSRNTVAR